MTAISTDYERPGWVRPISEGEQFFYDHAGYGYNPQTETPEEGRWRGARALRDAELHAERSGWWVEWQVETDPIEDDVERDEEYDQFAAILRDEDGEILGSLGSIDLGPGQVLGYDARPHTFEGGPLVGEPLRKVYDPYVRVVEAELAEEAKYNQERGI